jgi:pyruvate dehydrogenase E1 component
MVPFYIFYSMFGFQRIGDLAWAAGDSQARGFLIGATAGRTTLNGEGLQHQDGHSHLMAATVPNCISYDPTYSYELAVIIQEGMRRMFEEGENCFYYITTMNENYVHPDMPEGVEEGIVRGLYRLSTANVSKGPQVQLLGAGAILREVEAAAELLARDFGIAADVWSVTSVNELARDGNDALRWNRLHPTDTPRVPYITEQLADAPGPVIAATDYQKAHTDQLREFVPGSFTVLGTDGFGRSDTRQQLRQHFEVSREHIALAAIKALADQGDLSLDAAQEALSKLGIDADKPNPMTV